MVIIITLPDFFDDEASTVNRMFRLGLQRLHLRKPHCTAQELEHLIGEIDPQYHSRLVLHDHHHLATKYRLGGIHLNSRNPVPPQGFEGTISCSCHSLDELKTNPYHCTYRTISPIFDSISKQGYNAAFSDEQLRDAHSLGIINKEIYALGGVALDNIAQVAHYGFGGVLLLGQPWQKAATTDFDHYMTQLISADQLFI